MKSFLSAGVAAVALFALSQSALAGDPAAAKTQEKKCDKTPLQLEAERQSIAATPRTDAPSLGRADSKVTVEVWSDFECPFCARGADTIKDLRERYGDQVRIVFRHFPLPAHTNARLAAAASMAAHEQGRFWEFHDALFAHQGSLDRASLEALAGSQNLDLERFRRALDSSTVNNYVDLELSEGRRRGVAATPTFFVNGKPIMGAQPLSVFAQSIDKALEH